MMERSTKLYTWFVALGFCLGASSSVYSQFYAAQVQSEAGASRPPFVSPDGSGGVLNAIIFGEGDGDLGEYRDHVRFTNLREGMFGQIANAHRDDYSEIPSGNFDDLPKCGCRKHDLGSWHKAPKF